jgi:hypothetical protein
MKNYLFLLVCLSLITMNLRSQDVIRFKNGDSMKCKVTKTDSTNVYIEFEKNNQRINTYIELEKVLTIDYNASVKKKNAPNPNLRSTKHDIFLLIFDPLGFITMGPSLCGEIVMQGKNSSVGFGVYTGIRITNLGMASNLLLSAGTMKMSYSVPLACRIYTKTRNKTDGFFVGPHVEFGKTNFTDGDVNQIRAFSGEIGYKWVKKSGFTIELADQIGLIQTRYKYDDTYFYNDGNEYSSWEYLAFVPYMVSFKIGYTFGK